MTDRTQHRLCKMPRWTSRWKGRIYVCACNRLWTARWHGAGDGGTWGFEEVVPCTHFDREQAK